MKDLARLARLLWSPWSSWGVPRHRNAVVVPPDSAAPDGVWFKEWSECRATIGRLDSILVDLRKVGFSFATGLLTAGSFLSLLGATPSAPARGAAFAAIMVLVAALFAVDSHYEVLLQAAVERAMDLEHVTQVRLTTYLSAGAQATQSTVAVWLLYVVMLWTACLLGVLAARSVGVGFAVAGVGLLLFLAMYGYWSFCAYRVGLHRTKPR